MRLLIFTYLLILLLVSHLTYAQLGINGSAHPSAALDVKSPGNDKAFYPPRLSSAQRLAIPNPQAGAFVYDLDKGTMYLHDGQNWLSLGTTDPALLTPVNRTASDGVESDYFGFSVAISGDYAVVGAYGKTINNNIVQGAAYIFVRSGNTWSQQQRLTAADGATYDFFGKSVAISGDYAVVGTSGKAVNGANSQGAAYVFMRVGTGWTQQQRLTASDGAGADNFGETVAISGDNILVGVPNQAINNKNQQGAAYVFNRSATTWTQQQKLIAADGAILDLFGRSVAISGDYAVVGASSKAINGVAEQGAAYVFYRSAGTWIQQQRLTASNGANGNNFGRSVAIYGDHIAVGAPYKTVGSNSGQGAAYVFDRSGTTWTEKQLLINDGAAYDFFGASVSLSGNYAVVGAYLKKGSGNTFLGAAYVFKQTNSTANWALERKVVDNSTDGAGNGGAVGISNGTFIIGGASARDTRGKVAFGTVD